MIDVGPLSIIFMCNIITIIVVEFILLLGPPISVILKEIRLYAYRKPYHNFAILFLSYFTES